MTLAVIRPGKHPVIRPGENAAEAARQAVRAAGFAERAAASEAVALAAAGPNYANTAAGLADTSEGETFAVEDDGIVTVYRHDSGPTATELRVLPTTAALASPGGLGMLGYVSDMPDAEADTAAGKLRRFWDVLDWIPSILHADIRNYTSTTDVSTYIQNAIDAVSASGGGSIAFPAGLYRCNIVVKEGVTLTSGLGTHGYPAGSVHPVRLLGANDGWVIDTPATKTLSVAIIGLAITGPNSGTSAVGGIRFQDTDRSRIVRCSFNNLEDQAILIEDGLENEIAFNLGVNCLLDRTRDTRDGVLQLNANASDNYIHHNEMTPSTTEVTGANLRVCACVCSGANNFFESNQFEIADIGLYLAGTLNRLVNNRTDLNWGHGLYNDGSSNQVDNHLSLNNSRDTTDTYDGFFASSDAANNLYSNCFALSNATNDHRYGFRDEKIGAVGRNSYSNPLSVGAATADYSASSGAASWIFPFSQSVALTANSATPSVARGLGFHTANTTATTITNFTGGVDGQIITIRCADDNTTVQHNGASISLPGNVNLPLVNGLFYSFRRDGVWRFIGRSPAVRAANIADADTAHALNATFSDTEVEGALNALATKINSIIAILEANGMSAPS